MTVCLAAICDQGKMIIGAADRMLTAGDIQFQPPQTKMLSVTRAVTVMCAGDSFLQAEIMSEVESVISARVLREPDNWWLVSDVAALYRQQYHLAKRRRAEDALLSPLGLDFDSFLSRQRELDPALVSRLTADLLAFQPPRTEAIFAGLDPRGAHILFAEDGSVNSADGVGFAAIGAGAGHANSQFMFAGHTRFRDVPETLWMVYSAKKRAEVAPGVGEATDMFVLGPNLGNYFPVRSAMLSHLEKLYERTHDGLRTVEDKALRFNESYFQAQLERFSAQRAEEQESKQEQVNGAEDGEASRT